MTKLLIELDININLKEKMNNRLKSINLEQETYILYLINKDINSKLYFENNFYFDYEKDKLFNENKEINFTENQNKIFKYLLNNCNSVVSSEELENLLKYATKDSVRNYIMQLRIRTYKDLIKTINGNGYMIMIKNKNDG